MTRSSLSIRSLLLALALLFAAAAPAADARPDEDLEAARVALDGVLLNEGSTAQRAKAVHALARLNSPAAAQVLIERLERLSERTGKAEKDAEKTRVAYEPYAGYSFKDPKAWDVKKRIQRRMEREDKLLQSDGVVLLAFGTGTTLVTDTEALGVLTRGVGAAKYPHSRRALYAGLLRNALVGAFELGKKALRDSDAAVRLVALEALAERKDPATLEIGVKALKEKGWPHRQAAATLLKNIDDVKAVPPLVGAIVVEDGRLIEVYADALKSITGVKIGPFPGAWKTWYDENKQELAERGARAGAIKKPRKRSAAVVNYYGIETRSRRILFLIDISGSMDELIGDPEMQDVTGEKPEEYHGKKIEIAKKVLKRAIRNLPEEAFFNIITFNHSVKVFSKTSLEANQKNKNEAYLMINELEPSGATYTYGALKEAFRMAGRGVSDKAYDPGVDTIFVLSDGAPTDDDIESAKLMDGNKINDQVTQWNQLKRVQIHTVAIDPRIGKGPFVKFMKALAHQNRGTYAEIGNK